MIVLDAVDALAIYAGATVVVYIIMDVWEDFFK